MAVEARRFVWDPIGDDVRSHVAEPQEFFSSRDPEKARFIGYALSFELSTIPNGPVVWAVQLSGTDTHTDTYWFLGPSTA